MSAVEILLIVALIAGGIVALLALVGLAALIFGWLIDRIEAADPDVLGEVLTRERAVLDKWDSDARTSGNVYDHPDVH